MNKKQLIVVCIMFFCFTKAAYAYFENYPPYKFKDGAPKHLELQPLVDFDKPEYKSKDGRVTARLKESDSDTYDFIIKDGKTVLVNKKDRETPLPYALYQADLDKNGLDDFIVFSNYRGCGLAAQQDAVDIFLKKEDGSYCKFSYDTMSSGLEDFVDMNKDGKYEVIVTDVYSGDKHSYFTYDIYEFKDYKLVNVDAKFKGFSKFIWFTDKSNDKDTTHLTNKERAAHVNKKNNAIKYADIKCAKGFSKVIKPLPEKEVKLFLKQLNSRGMVASLDKNLKKDKILWWIKERACFSLWPGGVGYYIYKADMNNDGINEYVLCSQQGSGSFFDIEAVYQDRKGKFADIFSEIKIPMRKLIIDAEKKNYDLEEGYTGFMNGSITIEKENGKVFFTLEQVTRKYEGKGFEEDFNSPQAYKFLWDKGDIKLIEYRVGK